MSYPDLPTYVDSTMMSCFRSCPQKFFLEFVHGYRPKGRSLHLHAGGCFAGALEETYKQLHVNNRSLDQALLVAQARFFTEWGDFEIPDHYKKTAKTPDRVWEAVEDYFRVYAPHTDHIQPYFDSAGKATFEYTFAIPLEPTIDEHSWRHFGNHETPGGFPLHPNGAPFLYVGRIDLLGKYLGHTIWRDEKTATANPETNSHWSEQWDLRSQFIGYTWALQQLGFDCEGGVVRGIGILKEKFGHAEAYKVYSETLIKRWYEQLRRDLWRIRRAYDERYFDFNLGEACTAYGSCIFTRVCQSTDGSSWLNEFEVRKWNPLEKDPTKAAA